MDSFHLIIKVMKRFIIYFSCIFLFASCEKNTLKTFEIEKVWKDPQEKMDYFKKEILSNKDGWEIRINNGLNGGVTAGYIRFDSENNAQFLVDFSDLYSSLQKTEVDLSVKERNPSLIFPANSTFGYFTTYTKSIDSIYNFNKVINDTIYLEGVAEKSSLKLIKCNAQTANQFVKNRFEENKKTINSIFHAEKFFFYLNTLNNSYDLEMDTINRFMKLQYKYADSISIASSYYFFNGVGITLEKPITLDGQKIEHLNLPEIKNGKLNFQNTFSISNESKPKIYDPKSIDRFLRKEPPIVWSSFDGFSTRKQNDIAKMKRIPRFTEFVIYPRYGLDSAINQEYGFVGFILGDYFGEGIENPIVDKTAENLVKFRPLGGMGPRAKEPNTVHALKEIFKYIYNPKGFYIIPYRTGYYLVDARDGLTWAYFVNLANN
ncbi:hypothetical protein CHT99_15155 [Sphingobacterium cellulitidis]|nr:hypothetical protein CHT99_15155 [Sphingobacterium cellulitidis]